MLMGTIAAPWPIRGRPRPRRMRFHDFRSVGVRGRDRESGTSPRSNCATSASFCASLRARNLSTGDFFFDFDFTVFSYVLAPARPYRHHVNDENRSVFDDINDLNPPISLSASDDLPLAAADLARIRTASRPNHLLDLEDRNTM